MIFPTDDTTYSAGDRSKMKPRLDGYSSNEIENVKRTESELGHSQFLDVWNRTRFVAQWTVEARNLLIGYLWNFWRVHRAGTTFTFFDFEENWRTAVSLGVATGAAQVFDIPAKEVSSLVLYKNGVAIAGGSVTLGVGTGAEGRDRATLSAGAALAGQVITASFLGRSVYTCEYPEPPTKRTSGVGRQEMTITVREAFN